MKFLLPLVLILLAGPAFADEHTVFTGLLNEHVHEGHVRYATLCKDPRLREYIEKLSRTDPAADQDRDRRLAFWLNAYNAVTLQVICEHYPVKSINDLHTGGLIIGTLIKGTIWDKKTAVIHGEAMSLNHIEHEIVRKQFQDPRVHFALVCASVSCPALRSEAYEADTLDRQLDDQAREFFGDRNKNHFDTDTKTAHLSKILNWYSGDFGRSKEDVLRFVARYLPAGIRSTMESDPSAWKIRYTEYNWSLNE